MKKWPLLVGFVSVICVYFFLESTGLLSAFATCTAAFYAARKKRQLQQADRLKQYLNDYSLYAKQMLNKCVCTHEKSIYRHAIYPLDVYTGEHLTNKIIMNLEPNNTNNDELKELINKINNYIKIFYNNMYIKYPCAHKSDLTQHTLWYLELSYITRVGRKELTNEQAENNYKREIKLREFIKTIDNTFISFLKDGESTLNRLSDIMISYHKRSNKKHFSYKIKLGKNTK